MEKCRSELEQACQLTSPFFLFSGSAISLDSSVDVGDQIYCSHPLADRQPDPLRAQLFDQTAKLYQELVNSRSYLSPCLVQDDQLLPEPIARPQHHFFPASHFLSYITFLLYLVYQLIQHGFDFSELITLHLYSQSILNRLIETTLVNRCFHRFLALCFHDH